MSTNLPTADFYLFRIAFVESSMCRDRHGCIHDFLSLCIERARVREWCPAPTEIQADLRVLEVDLTLMAERPCDSIRNRLFTWEEYKALRKGSDVVILLADEIDAKPPFEDELESAVVLLRKVLEPQLLKSHERATRQCEF